jgi:hypothetical protein
MKSKILIFFGLFFLCCIAGCKEETPDAAPQHNPNVPVKVTHFTPDSGGAATQLMIYGENFGADAAKVSLTVGDKQAAVVGCSGTVIYALVPGQGRLDTGWYSLTLRVGEQEVQLPSQLHYTPKYMVRTLMGEFIDEARNGAVVDGSFEEARFNEPYWLTFDEKKNLYLIEENNGLRYIDFENKTVETKFRTGGGFARPRTITFTPSFDTMIIVNDAGEWTGMGHAMLTRASNFKEWRGILNSRQCNGSAFHPVNTGNYFFNSYENSQVFGVKDFFNEVAAKGWTGKNIENDIKSYENFRWEDVQWEFNIQFAPSGNFAYLVSINRHYIGKANYNWTSGKLEEAAKVFVGGKSASGYADGSGEEARFNKPHQGAFDEHDNFYLCDALNQCIRKITPDGVVTTFAGRPGQYGMVDGDLRTAQFDRPWGIVYDSEKKIFYVADQKNRRIRMITIE